MTPHSRQNTTHSNLRPQMLTPVSYRQNVDDIRWRMLGGNSSSEIRRYPEVSTNHGICSTSSNSATTKNASATTSPTSKASGTPSGIWGSTNGVVREPNFTLFLNTTIREVERRAPNAVLGVHAYQLGTEKKYLISAPLFVDSRRDGIPLRSCYTRYRTNILLDPGPPHWHQHRRELQGPRIPSGQSLDTAANTLRAIVPHFDRSC